MKEAMIEILKPDFVFENECGVLKQLVHEGWNQVNIITSVRDSVRGGHYHKSNKEAFYIIKGSFKLELKRGRESESYMMKEGDMFVINSLVTHQFYYIEETTLISMYSVGVELPDGTKDIWSGMSKCDL